MIKLKNLLKILCLTSFCVCASLSAQNRRIDSLVTVGDSLHAEYSFADALEAYTLAMEELKDSVLAAEDSLMKAEIKIGEQEGLLSFNSQTFFCLFVCLFFIF